VTLLRAALAVGLAGLTAAATTSCVASNRPAAGNTSGKQPIVFVHGFTMQNTGMWSVARTQAVASGYRNGDLTEFNYNSTVEGAEASSRKLGDVINRVAGTSPTGKVDIIAHSEGNLVSETCFVLGSCSGKVDHWVNMAGAQNGTALASAIVVGGGGAADMNPLSLLVTRVNLNEKKAIAEQGIKTLVFYSLTDGVIVPGNLCVESFARNVPFVGTHLTVYADPGVVAQSLNFLKG
jgi:triacylglycerol esterase/lipase EstA (alpha/beta hydrolase family)